MNLNENAYQDQEEMIIAPLHLTKKMLKALLQRTLPETVSHDFPSLFNPDLLLKKPPLLLKKSAVCILVVGEEEAPEILFTLRSEGLPHHQGEVSFPGGLSEENDLNATATALRETYEEIGLPSSSIDVIDSLPPLITVSGYHVTPIVGITQLNTQTLNLNENEVSEVFTVPLSFLFNPENVSLIEIIYQESPRCFYSLNFENKHIWGITAAILQGLYEKLVRHQSFFHAS